MAGRAELLRAALRRIGAGALLRQLQQQRQRNGRQA